jgi:hypothetical protein
MRDGETKQEYAFRRTFLLIKGDVADNLVQSLITYINSLTDKELDVYIRLAENLYDRRHLGARSIKVSANAIKLCLRLSECDTKTFPYIKKIATKGWDTAGGTYSFSMPVLNTSIDNEICSFGPIASLLRKDAKLEVFYNEHTRSTEVDFK